MHTRYKPPFPSSHPHVCRQVTAAGSSTERCNFPASVFKFWSLAEQDWLEYSQGPLQIVAIIQQGFSNLHQHHLKRLFQMYTLFEPKLQSLIQSGIWPRNLHFYQTPLAYADVLICGP